MVSVMLWCCNLCFHTRFSNVMVYGTVTNRELKISKRTYVKRVLFETTHIVMFAIASIRGFFPYRAFPTILGIMVVASDPGHRGESF